jgi:uncharacterized protein
MPTNFYKVDMRRLGLTILTTEACNFSCFYCHQKHNPTHLRQEVAQSIEKFVERRAPGLDRLDISWFGGEPLVNKKMVVELSKKFVRICVDNDIALHSAMSTNAYYLDRDLFSELLQLEFKRFQITFDGPSEIHNKSRTSKNGEPTFATIWNNVVSYKPVDREFEIIIRVHVRPETAAFIPDFLMELSAEFASDARYKIMLTDVRRWGGPQDDIIQPFEDRDSSLASLRALIAPKNVTIEDNEFCSAADPTHFTIRPDGTILKCAHSLYLEKNRMGRLNAEGEFEYEKGKIDYWIRGLVTGDTAALRCPLMAHDGAGA